MTTIVLTRKDWKNLSDRIKEEYGVTTLLISWRLKRELGFTVRSHMYYDEFKQRIYDTRLDFDDPARATFFQLKYL
jgi:hypothetical protein